MLITHEWTAIMGANRIELRWYWMDGKIAQMGKLSPKNRIDWWVDVFFRPLFDCEM